MTIFYTYALLVTYAFPVFAVDPPPHPTPDVIHVVYAKYTVGSTKVTPAEQATIDAVNDYRKKYRLPPMKADPILMAVAKARVKTFAHRQPPYGWSWEHAAKWGFQGTCADNLAKGYDDGPDAVAGWSRDVGHARQMRGYFKLNGQWEDRHFDKIGVAIDHQSKQCIAIFGALTKSQ